MRSVRRTGGLDSWEESAIVVIITHGYRQVLLDVPGRWFGRVKEILTIGFVSRMGDILRVEKISS